MPTRTDNRQMTMPFEAAKRATWRPIHYLGSKLRLADSIRELVAEIDPERGTVCDLFAGSGTVSLALAGDRRVIAADIQEYSRVLCTALLQPAAVDKGSIQALVEQTEHGELRNMLDRSIAPILEHEKKALEAATVQPKLLCDLVEHGSLVGQYAEDDALGNALSETRSLIARDGTAAKLMTTRYFGGTYFSYRQAVFIDCVLAAIESMSRDWHDTLRAALLSTASNIVNTIGKHFAQPIRPRHKDGSVKQHVLQKMSRDRCLNPALDFARWLSRYSELPRTHEHRVIRGDFRDVLSQVSGVSVIYADPPYTRDHYSRFYHVLETLCLRDFPDVSTTSLDGAGPLSRGVYRADRHQSPFCIKSQAPAAFVDLCAGARSLGASMLVSYSPFVKDGHPRLMTIDSITQIARDHFAKVDAVPAGALSHSKLNKSELHLDASTDAEVFIVCQA
jgi:adenine-specific DNA methylase